MHTYKATKVAIEGIALYYIKTYSSLLNRRTFLHFLLNYHNIITSYGIPVYYHKVSTHVDVQINLIIQSFRAILLS